MKNLLVIFLLAALFQSHKKIATYRVTEYGQKNGVLYIRLDDNKKPIYVDHYFTAEEQKTTATKAIVVAKLIEGLEEKSLAYKTPIKTVNNLKTGRGILQEGKKEYQIRKDRRAVNKEQKIIENKVYAEMRQKIIVDSLLKLQYEKVLQAEAERIHNLQEIEAARIAALPIIVPTAIGITQTTGISTTKSITR